MSTRRRRWRLLRKIVAMVPGVSRARARHLRRHVARSRKTAIVYVDGFNLYRNCLQKHPEVKWLDLVRLCELLLPGFDIKLVRFFTAEIHALRGTDPRAPSRQKAYLRALEELPRLTIHRGRFNQAKRIMELHPLQKEPDGSFKKVRVRKLEEKQSDVNLGARMVLDASHDEADVYVLLSSDSDFAGLMNLMIGEMGRTMGLISPIESMTAELTASGPKYLRKVRLGVALDSQLPDTMRVRGGTVHRPPAWQKSRGPNDVEAPRPVAEASGVVDLK